MGTNCTEITTMGTRSTEITTMGTRSTEITTMGTCRFAQSCPQILETLD
jgi:hypothetical protein